MKRSELSKRFFVFLIFAGIMIAALIVLPFAQPFLKSNVVNFFGGLESTGQANMGETAGGLFDNFIKVFKIILWMGLVIAIVRLFSSLIFNNLLRSIRNLELARLVRNVVSILLYIVALTMIVKSQFDTDLTTFFAGSTIIAVVIGLALQDTLGNLFAGIAMQADQPFQVGDVVNIPGKGTGVVESVSWRGVKIRTFQNKLLIISNAILGKEIIEVSAKTVQVVRELVRQCENISQKIRPVVRVRNLGDNGIEWEVKFWLEDYSKYNDTDALVRQRIWYAFQREAIGIPFPTRTLELKRKETQKVDTGAEDTIFDRLAAVEIFAPLTDEEALRLAHAAVKRVFAPKESIVRAGEEGHSMFVIHSGSVNVQVDEAGQVRTVTTLHEGDIFGEMSLFTGEPRTATVTAAQETEVLEIGHFALKPLFENNPDLAGAISKTIADRHLDLLAKRQEDATADAEVVSSGIFNSIKKFFRLEQKQ
jgi:small-conductance mechanosensitive channel/CRP-like cAMP-binding protein